MMKKLGIILLAIMLVPALALAASLEGTIKKVDKSKNEIVLQTDEGEKTLQLSGDTQGLEHARAGAKVRIDVKEDGGKQVATSIIAAGAAPASRSRERGPRMPPSESPARP